MSKTFPPGTDTKTQYFARNYPGSKMDPNVLLWHSTEGPSFPSNSVYRNGATAPNVTARVNIGARTLSIRGHYPANMSSRALVNAAGGVETNVLNIFQVELVGTCDPSHRRSWGNLRAGVDYIYWPDAEPWMLELIAQIPAWLHAEYPAFPIEDGAPRGWLPYPDSYGNKNGQRMTAAEWNAGRGMLGHQHAQENHHGDPGDLDVDLIVFYALGGEGEVTGPETPAGSEFVDPNLYPRFGTSEGAHITWLRGRLEEHLRALDLPIAATPTSAKWSEGDRANVQTFQEAQGWAGDDADGYNGPTTLSRLAAPIAGKPDPKPDPEPVPEADDDPVAFWGLFWNAYGGNHGDKAGGDLAWSERGPKVVDAIVDARCSLVLLCEINTSLMRYDIDAGLGTDDWQHIPSAGRNDMFSLRDRWEEIEREDVPLGAYQHRNATAVLYERAGERLTVVNTHMPSGDPEAREVQGQVLAEYVDNIVGPVLVTGDFNNTSPDSGGNPPRKQLEDVGFVDWRDQCDVENAEYNSHNGFENPPAQEGTHLDGVYTRGCKITDGRLVLAEPGISDHFMLIFRVEF